MDCVSEGSKRVESGEWGEGVTLIVVEKASIFGNGGETGGNNSFQDIGHGLKENHDAE